jgi:hypothetical protein
MKTQYYTAASLDGFIATSDDSLEWLFPLADINATSYPEFITQVGALAMGSAAYAWIVHHVVKPDSPTPGAWPYQPPAWVFSRRGRPRHCRGRHSICARRCASHPCPDARRRAREESLAGRGWRAGGTVLRRRTARRADHSNWLSHAWGWEAIATASDHLTVSPAGVGPAIRHGSRGATV